MLEFGLVAMRRHLRENIDKKGVGGRTGALDFLTYPTSAVYAVQTLSLQVDYD